AHATAMTHLEHARDLLREPLFVPVTRFSRVVAETRRGLIRNSAFLSHGSTSVDGASNKGDSRQRLRRRRTSRRQQPLSRNYEMLSSNAWKRPACDFSALASVSNQSAISLKPSSRAVLAMPGYMSVYSCVSPAT